jgi:endonuclease/exonuclease/phosphatase family metal-dependent hydrolase
MLATWMLTMTGSNAILTRRLITLIVLLVIVGSASCSQTGVGVPEAGRSARELASANAETSDHRDKDAPVPAASIRVMTWNLEWFFDDDTGDNFSQLAKEQSAPSRDAWNWKRDAVAEAIATASPDIAGFQEIEGRRAIWYLTRALLRDHDQAYDALSIDGTDVFTEQDVGFIYRPAAEDLMLHPLRQSIFGRDSAMKGSERYSEVSKHLAVEFEVRLGDVVEHLTIMNVHLRARAEGNEIRIRQARTVHAWLADKIASGGNVIVLGDFNTDVNEVPAPPGTDMYAASGKDTPAAEDDLVDLHQFLPANQRRTHLLPGKSFDRILVSRSLLTDDPDRVDLTFDKIERLRELSIRGAVDSPGEHFDNYWQLDDAERDISDHWPIMATFRLQ